MVEVMSDIGLSKNVITPGSGLPRWGGLEPDIGLISNMVASGGLLKVREPGEVGLSMEEREEDRED